MTKYAVQLHRAWRWRLSLCAACALVGVARHQPALAARGTQRSLRSHLPRPDHRPDAGRPAARRSHAAHRAAGGHGPADRRPAARALGVRRAVSRHPARLFPARQRAEGDDRCDLAVRHPDAAAAHRHGDRPQAGARSRPGAAFSVSLAGIVGAVRLRLRARRIHARCHAAAIPASG